ncbi:MAG: Wzz/FepE/Etk N-terminal domain-containing protein [Clostridia bacterium]
MEEEVIRIDDLIEALKKRWIMIVTITVLATLISGVVSFFLIKPQYEASTKVFIGKEEGADEAYNNNDIQMYQKLMKTYSETIKTKDLLNKALKTVKTDLKVEDVMNGITVVPVADTQILQIKFKSTSPEDAKNIIQAVTDEFMTTSKELVPNGNIRVIETVETPKNPVSPNKKMNIAIAFLLGLMVSVGLTFLLEFLDNTFKSKDEMERILELPVLGVIPNIDEY